MYQVLFHKIYESRATLLIIKLKDILLQIDSPTENERHILLEERKWTYYAKPEHRQELAAYYGEYEEEDRRLVFDYTLSGLAPIMQNGIIVLADTSSKYYNVVNNCRLTTDNPDKYNKTLYLFGYCNAVGCFAEDKHTLASQLQRKINETMPNEVRVINAANWQNFKQTACQILSPKFRFSPGDLILILSEDIDYEACMRTLKKFSDPSFFNYADLSRIFQRPHAYGEILFDTIHMNHKGYALLAQQIHSLLTTILEERKKRLPSLPRDLRPYMHYLSSLKKKQGAPKNSVGALVMNCNPFTLGHNYLVTEALKRCDHLYIFILDEDKSFFKFDDRIAMVKLGLQGVNNISVIPSGKTIISSETMPEYFTKDTKQDITIDTSYDLNLFATLIAPALGITKRFAGNEPFCHITRQYNFGMQQILPKHGIEFIELPRYATGETPISASRVRACLKENNHEELKKLVPPTTYAYILQKGYIQAS